MRHLLTISFSVLLFACQTSENSSPPPSAQASAPQSLDAASPFQFKTAFANHFLVGTALSKEQILDDEKIKALVEQQFNALTPENEMKWERIQPQPGVYDWTTADALVAYAQQYNMFITGHTLVWHQQVPDWVFQDASGEPASAELLSQRMNDHISKVVGRYQGKVQSWDVVNEAFNEDGSYRESPWFNILGPQYIEQAFKLAHNIDPNAKLYYNDYNLWRPEKRDAVINLVTELQKKGIPIHGIGLQGHYGLNHPENIELIEEAIVAFHALGVDVMITELDVTVIPFPEGENQGADISLNIALQEKYNPYPNGLTQEAQRAFDQQYLQFFKVFMKHSDKLTRVTFWGVHDAQSWRNGWPIAGRTDYPLLIDRDLNIKPVAHSLVRAEQL